MAEFDFTLRAAPILGGVDLTIADNRLTERDDLALVSIAVPLGGDAGLTEALKNGWGLDLPTAPGSATAGEVRAIRTAPDQLMLVFPHREPDAARQVAAKLDGRGYVTDQTDAWVVLEISGPDTPAALERLTMLDVSDDRFPEGAAARTLMHHMGAILIRLGATRYLLLSASSSALSFLDAVETSYRNVTA